VGLILGARSPRDQTSERAIFLGVSALVCALLALGRGPFGWDPYVALSHLIPGFSSIRTPTRFLEGTAFAASGLYGYAVALGSTLARPTWMKRGVLLLGFAVSVAPMAHASQLDLVEIPVGDRIPRAYAWLRTFGDGGPLLEWPVSRNDVIEQNQAAWALYYSTTHWLPLVNGFTGYVPSSYADVLKYARDVPNRDAIDVLAACTGVRWILVHNFRRSYAASFSAGGLTQRALFAGLNGPSSRDAIFEVPALHRPPCPISFP
jgi:hypothetical protein